MNNNINCRHCLLQQDLIPYFPRCLRNREWTVLYESNNIESMFYGSSSALISPRDASKLLEFIDWDLLPHAGRPEVSVGVNEMNPKYHKYGFSHETRRGIRPLIHLREFSGSYSEYVEIIEDFRLLHNLAERTHPEDRFQKTLFQVGDTGGETEVAKIKRNKIIAKTEHLREFQRQAGLCLVLYIDSKRSSKIPLGSIPNGSMKKHRKSEKVNWEFCVEEHWDSSRYSTISRFIGKAIIPPPTPARHRFYPSQRVKKTKTFSRKKL